MDFGAYLRKKHEKLDEQRAQAPAQPHTPTRTRTPTRSPIFAGLTIYITGHTEPSAAVLMDLVTAHGGRICPFFSSKNSATHIIAESLTARKSELWASYQVATPAWIVESVREGRRLDWAAFRTIQSEEARQRAWITAERRNVNCLDPAFISDYFGNSRLHMISARKRQLRQQLRQAPAPLVGPIMHIDFDSFFVAAALKDRPDLRDRPVCVSHGSENSDVASCNYVARKFGVANGIWVGRARELCPDLVCLPYDFSAYQRYSEILYKVLEDSGAYVCPVSIDEALLNLSACGPPRPLAEHLRAQIKLKTGLSVSVGVGPNILLAKLALRIAKPDGIHIFESPESAREVIARTPVAKIPGVGYITSSKLAQLGVAQLGDLQRVHPATLEAKIGPAAAQRLRDATRGNDSCDLGPLNQPPKTVGVDIAWGVRTLSHAEINTFATRLVAELWDRKDQGTRATSVSIKVYLRDLEAPFIAPKYMGCGKCEILNRTLPLGQGTARAGIEATLLATLEGLSINPLRFRGLGLHLKCEPIAENQRRIECPPALRAPRTPRTPQREFVKLQPKRTYVALTQINPALDEEVFDALPEDIKQEILQHPEMHKVRIGSHARSHARTHTRTRTPTHAHEPPEKYYPINLLGTIRSEADIRQQVKQWISVSPEGPFYEDALEFYRYIESVLADDWNWLKAVSLVGWLEFQVDEQRSCANWRYFAQLTRARLDGAAENVEASIEACSQEDAAPAPAPAPAPAQAPSSRTQYTI